MFFERISKLCKQITCDIFVKFGRQYLVSTKEKLLLKENRKFTPSSEKIFSYPFHFEGAKKVYWMLLWHTGEWAWTFVQPFSMQPFLAHWIGLFVRSLPGESSTKASGWEVDLNSGVFSFKKFKDDKGIERFTDLGKLNFPMLVQF